MQDFDYFESVWLTALAVQLDIEAKKMHIGILIVSRNAPKQVQIGDFTVNLKDELVRQGRVKVATETDLAIIG